MDNARLIRSYLQGQSYLQGMDPAALTGDRRTRDAVERCLERLSEAAAKLGAPAEQLAPGPPWQAVRSLGNILRHACGEVDPDRIWEIATRDLPPMIAAVPAALQRLGGATD